MNEAEEKSPLLEKRINAPTKFAYALGHIFNDLAAAMWFSYTLIYFQRVALLEPVTAGALLLLGQIVDAFVTPIFGFLVDRYSKKKVWHIIGSVMVTLTFPIIFGGFAAPTNAAAMFLYVTSITIFQIGWAAVQISHLSMIPSLTNSLLARADLTAIRYSAQVGAAVMVFIITWIILPTNEESLVRLDQQDNYKFRYVILVLGHPLLVTMFRGRNTYSGEKELNEKLICLHIVIILTSVGITTTILFQVLFNTNLLDNSIPNNLECLDKYIFATILFHVFLKANLLENSAPHKSNIEEATRFVDNSRNNHNSWVSTTILLKVAMLYVASRLFITLATIYLPLYIEESDIDGKEALATVPLVSYVSSFIAAFLLKYINKSCGTKVMVFQ